MAQTFRDPVCGMEVTPETAAATSEYQDKRRNAPIITASVIALLGFFLLIRQQTAFSDKQFLGSMIPHYARASLMCEHAAIDGPEIKAPCQNIISSQQVEIDQMKAK